MSTKKTPSISEQIRDNAADFEGWVRGDTRFRITIADKNGSRSTFHATRAELEAIKIRRAAAFKEIRSALHLSQARFARLLHVATGTLKGWEIARRAVPEHVYRLAELARDIPAARKHLEATAEGKKKAIRPAGRKVAKASNAGIAHTTRTKATKKRALHS
jgi:DNA-binding transcriptional regulator YiaG